MSRLKGANKEGNLMRSISRAGTRDNSQRKDVQHPQRLSLLAMFAIAGKVLLLASAWLLPLVSEYRLIGDTISETALGRYGFVQTVAFAVSGLGTLGLAFTIRQLTAGTRGSLVGTLLLAVYGAGAILSAIFPTDPVESAGVVWAQAAPNMIVHMIVGLVSFLSVTVGVVMLTWTFSWDARWRQLTTWFALLATGTVSLFIAQSVEQVTSPRAGLMQRLLVTIIAAWLILAALRVRALAMPVAHKSDA
jgi:hypothetical protein